MKLFKIQIMATDSKRCGDQSWLCPLQPLRAAFSTASASGEETDGIRHVEPEQSPESVAWQTSYIYRVSQEEWTKLRESVPYVKIYRYNPKHLYPKLNDYGDNGQRSLKV